MRVLFLCVFSKWDIQEKQLKIRILNAKLIDTWNLRWKKKCVGSSSNTKRSDYSNSKALREKSLWNSLYTGWNWIPWLCSTNVHWLKTSIQFTLAETDLVNFRVLKFTRSNRKVMARMWYQTQGGTHYHDRWIMEHINNGYNHLYCNEWRQSSMYVIVQKTNICWGISSNVPATWRRNWAKGLCRWLNTGNASSNPVAHIRLMIKVHLFCTRHILCHFGRRIRIYLNAKKKLKLEVDWGQIEVLPKLHTEGKHYASHLKNLFRSFTRTYLYISLCMM